MKTTLFILITIFCVACRKTENVDNSFRNEPKPSEIDLSGKSIRSVREIMSVLKLVEENMSDDHILSKIEFEDTESGTNHYSINSSDIFFTVKYFSTETVGPFSPALLLQKVTSIESDNGSRTSWRFQNDGGKYKRTHPK